MQNLTNRQKYTAYFILILSASFYLYEYILQVAPSVMASAMMRTFGVDASGFGIISAFYFYAYAPMQLPAGILFDRYGPRKLMTYAVILCAVGSFFFAATDTLYTAALGRFMIGVGSAFSFIGVLVLISRWFPPQQFAFLAGVAQLMSSVGAIFGELPLAALIAKVGWRPASFILAFLGLLLAGLIWWIVRDYPRGHPEKLKYKASVDSIFKYEWQRLISVCRHSYTWSTALYACAIWTPIAIFASLWGVPYLEQKYQISVISASAMCSLIWIGIGLGSPALGWLSDRLNSRKIALILSALFGLVASIFLLYVPDVALFWMSIILFLFGVGASGQTVSFAVVKENNPAELVGTASGFNNLAVLIGGAVFQPLVGIMLEYSYEWRLVDNVPVYSVSSYTHALFILPLSFFIALMTASFLIKETHPGFQH